MTVQVGSALESWRQTHFGTSSGTGQFANDADKDKDGLPNLVEYALGLSPNTASPWPLTIRRDGALLKVGYSRLKTATGVSCVIEWSDSLTGTWSSAGVSSAVITEDASRENVEATVSAGTAGRRYLRLRAVIP